MNCKKIQELLKTDYFDGEIKPGLKERIEDHIKICPDCQKIERVLRATREPFKNIVEIQPPEETWDKIKKRIEFEKEAIGIFAKTK